LKPFNNQLSAIYFTFIKNIAVKKSVFTLLLFFGVTVSFAQTTTADYTTLPMPAFGISKVPDSSLFTRGDLSKDKETIIMIFSPDCEHCQRETDSLIAHIDLFKDVQIVMASPLDYVEISKFYKDYHIANYPVITMGRDGSYVWGKFFNVHNFPSIYVYDKNGQLKKSFEGSYAVQKIAAVLEPVKTDIQPVVVQPVSVQKDTVATTVIPSNPKVGNSFVLKNVFFDTKKATLKPASFVELNKVIKLLINNPTMKIQINGYTDTVGDDQDNIVLSNARAAAVVKYILSKKSITADRLSSKGFGAANPIADNATEKGRAVNRRVEFSIISN
jgi:outer membrane protein OmpA-like peptidoglycan-associated protein